MARKKSKDKGKPPSGEPGAKPKAQTNLGQAQEDPFHDNLTKLESVPTTYQEISDFFGRFSSVPIFALRKETFCRIERITGRPLICYVAKTNNLVPGIPAHIDNSDLIGFSDLVSMVSENQIDVFLVSNGGSPEATERIVDLLRSRFAEIRFFIPGNAYSAATLMTFAGDEIIMDDISTLGPIDPQLNGIPARAILRAFEAIEDLVKKEGIQALAPYGPLIQKYDLHTLEICKSAQELSNELAKKWLKEFMFRNSPSESQHSDRIDKIVESFSSYDEHKSHSRSINRQQARETGLAVTFIESLDPALRRLVRSLYNQYEFCFDRTGFFKNFENSRGINWGRQAQSISVQIPMLAPPMPQPLPVQPGPPHPTNP